MIEQWIAELKAPRFIDGIPQTGTALWELYKLVRDGAEFPHEEIPFIESMLDGHYEQRAMADLLLGVIEGERSAE